MPETIYSCNICDSHILFDPYIRDRWGKSKPISPATQRLHYCGMGPSVEAQEQELINMAKNVIESVNAHIRQRKIVWKVEPAQLVNA
jgi:hypothetical protein